LIQLTAPQDEAKGMAMMQCFLAEAANIFRFSV
jgi:hypothetical protein